MRLLIAILLGKLIAITVRGFRIGGGSAAPGLWALLIEPHLVEKLIKQIPKNVVITGTNGKTTTARILAHLAKEAGLKVIRNHTGSNLERGIASTLISNYQLLTTNYPPDLGIWELDEAAFNSVVHKIKPQAVVFLNVFRDQLDRYGEIDTVVKNWCQTLKSLNKKTAVLVNGDDANTLKLQSCFKGQVETFGVEDYKIHGENLEHKTKNLKLDFEAKDVLANGLNSLSFHISKFLDRRKMINIYVKLPLPGFYHVYDALAAIASAHLLGFSTPKLVKSLKNFSPAFGRVEKLPFGFIFLIKNPAGATQVFETIAPNIKQGDRVLLALNDNLADGTDVSWIWDSQFEHLPKTYTVASGKRAHDLAVRLKYAGFDPKHILVEPNLKKALKEARTGLKGQLFILPTYTAMLELQGILAKSGLKPHYWEENLK
ncbi:DUF1727 domain-containing protein [Candidatus Daviesbacteria bacterium]|nr:DUF1727 domain-containing protein [Candidatus Daviesbacteria bacterium]